MLLEHFYWGSIFLVNLPVIVLALVGLVLVVPESRDPAYRRLDLAGALLSIVGLGDAGLRRDPRRQRRMDRRRARSATIAAGIA